MATTANMDITLLETAQAQKEITVNEALARIDAVLNSSVLDKDLATPPGSPVSGDMYIVAASPTGAWSGKALQLAYFDQVWRFIIPNEGLMLWVADEDRHYLYNGTSWQVVAGTSASSSLPGVLSASGRLTLTSATPVTTADVVVATTVYYTPFRGSGIALYNTTSAAWESIVFSQISIAVPATTNTNYDVFIYNSGGTPVAETVAWSNATSRATALVFQDGVYVKNGAASRRYVGTFRTTGTSGQTEDSKLKRFVWNYEQRVKRGLCVTDATNSWTYTTASWRQANGASANQVAIVIGVSEDEVAATVFGASSNSAGANFVSVGVGVDSSTVNAAQIRSGFSGLSTVFPNVAEYKGYPGVGYHELRWLEISQAGGTTTWYGDQGGDYISSGLTASLLG